MIAYQNEENYTLATPDWNNLNSSNLQEQINSLGESIEDFPIVILDCGLLDTLSEVAETLINYCEDKIKLHKGTFVVAEASESIAALLAEKDIQCIPSIDEAIDFVFMEQIEKSLDDNDE